LGRAIVRKPAAFLFDEPFSNLDAKLRTEMRAELKKLHDELATTIVYVTHDQAEAMTLGQRIIVMANGRIQQIGPPMEIYSRPRNRFVAEFIGTPSMNLATGDLRTDQDGWKFEGEGLSINLRKGSETLTKGLGQFAKQEITVGIRPEHVEVHATGPNSNPQKIVGRVVNVESLGDSALAYVKLDGKTEKTLVSRVSSHSSFRVGDGVELRIDARHAHLFDPQTGENVLYAEE
jgi:ABC-type sugar transport system ATPase subunit